MKVGGRVGAIYATECRQNGELLLYSTFGEAALVNDLFSEIFFLNFLVNYRTYVYVYIASLVLEQIRVSL